MYKNFRIPIVIMILFLIGSMFFFPSEETVLAQQPTIAIATVTSTVIGPYISVRPHEEHQINIREGPGTTYDKVGVLLAYQILPAKGRSAGGDWIMIEYPGIPGGLAWVYAPLVTLSGGELPIIEPPPTPTPQFTPTIDPTLAARFEITTDPTRLPTYTEPPPLNIPTIQAESQSILPTGLPIGLIIIVIFSAGFFIGLFTLAQGR